jgi:hypothetical protein
LKKKTHPTGPHPYLPPKKKERNKETQHNKTIMLDKVRGN